MEFNPSKCEAITFTQRTGLGKAKYNVHGTTLETVTSAKYLGVHISSKLTWNDYIDITTKKASQTLNLIRRNFSSCPTHVHEQCYKTLVRLWLEYTLSVWDNSVKRNINKVESVRRNAARFTCRFLDFGLPMIFYRSCSGIHSNNDDLAAES